MRQLLFIIPLLFLISCTSVQTYSQIDQTDKTITVPAGSKGLKGDLKKALSDAGWKMMVYQGPDVTEGTNDKAVMLQHYNTFHTRYTLAVNIRWTGVCETSYDISMIDNTTGAEVFRPASMLR